MRTVGTAMNAMLAAGQTQLSSSQELECLVQHAEWIMDRLAGLWNAVPSPLKVRLQAALFPDGIMVSQEGIGTGLTPIFCGALQPIPAEEISLGSQIDQSWNTFVSALRLVYTLRQILGFPAP